MKPVILTIIITAFALSASHAQFAGGSGTADDPYQVQTVEQLQEIQNHLDKHFIQIADIDASDTRNWNEGEGFSSIAGNSNDGSSAGFTGSYNGDGHTISGLYINRPDSDTQGLFGWIDGGTVENLGIIDADVTGNRYVGGLAGNNEGTIKNSFTSGGIYQVQVEQFSNSSDFEYAIPAEAFDIQVEFVRLIGGGGSGGGGGGSVSSWMGWQSGGGGGAGGHGYSWEGTDLTFQPGDHLQIIRAFARPGGSGGAVGAPGSDGQQGNPTIFEWTQAGETITYQAPGGGAGGGGGTWGAGGTGGEGEGGNGGSGMGTSGGAIHSNTDPSGWETVIGSCGNASRGGNGGSSGGGGQWAPQSQGGGWWIKFEYSMPTKVAGSESVGGLAGRNAGTIYSSFATGKVTGHHDDVGGFAGINLGSISNSYSTGDVTSGAGATAANFGGFVGANIENGQITSSFSTGEASGSDNMGGFAGLNDATIESSYWDTGSSETSNGVGSGPTGDLAGLTTDQMTGVDAYGYMDALDFEQIWHLTEGYPALQWQDGIEALPLPPRPLSLLTPEDGTINLGTSLVFAWTEEDRAEQYVIRIAEEEHFGILVIDHALTDTSFTPETPLDFETTYYWKVAAQNQSGISQSEIWSFTTRPEFPKPIVLVEPGKDTVIVSLTPTFTWQQDLIAQTYDFQLAVSESFNEPIVDAQELSDTTFATIEPLEYLSNYYWRVRGVGDLGEGEWSEIWSFSIQYALDRPVLVSPEEGLEDVPIPTTFYWKPVADALDYALEIATDPEFENLFDFDNGQAGGKQTAGSEEIHAGDNGYVSRLVETLEYDTQYFWRVRAEGEQGISDWSETRSLVTENAPITDPVVLSSPADESTDISLPVTLEWTPFDEAIHYDIEISFLPSFEDARTFESHEGTSLEISGLADTTQYFWRVRATVDEQMTPWSEAWSFTTELPVPDVPVWEPDQESDGVDTTPLLTWGASERAEMYDLQISKDAEFSDILIDASEIPQTEYHVTIELDKGVTYFWRVRAGNRSGYSDWSDSHSFTTEMPTGVDADQVPVAFMLEQNYPNPFNPGTQIRFAVPEEAHVRLTIYNMLGQHVSTLVNETRSPGWHDVAFDASGFSSGFYMYRLESGGFVETRRMMFVK